MIRIAAVGDVHYGLASRPEMRAHFAGLGARADLLLVAGDLTQSGSVEEARAFAADVEACPVPVIAVLGNHDLHRNQEAGIRSELRCRGVITLEGETARLTVRGRTVGVAGIKGFGGGFVGACCAEFGEPEMKAFARHGKSRATEFGRILSGLDAEYRFALMHYSPIEETLKGERREIYPFLGSYLFAEVIDASGVDAVFHGHAHLGSEKGATAGGIPVRNVALPVIRHSYHVYSFDEPRRAYGAGQATLTV